MPKRTNHDGKSQGPLDPESTPLEQLGYTVLGAVGSVLLTSMLAREGWEPKVIAGTVAAVGAGAAWQVESPTLRSLASGVSAGVLAQLTLLILTEKEAARIASEKAATEKTATAAEKTAAENTAGTPIQPRNGRPMHPFTIEDSPSFAA